MLARPAFDSDAHFFEIKWDGTRMLAFVEQNGYRLVNRHRAERTAQFPELSCLAELPAGIAAGIVAQTGPRASPASEDRAVSIASAMAGRIGHRAIGHHRD